mgnify:CR=1 FL=1
MEVSRKTDYALRILSILVKNPDKVISVRDAAQASDVPYSFARVIQHDLVCSHIVSSTRGAQGGMSLAVDPKEITLLDVVEAIQGPILIAGCESAGPDNMPCPRKASCSFNPVWCNAEKILRSYFASVTLSQIVEELSGSFRVVKSEKSLRADKLQKQVTDTLGNAHTQTAGQCE